MQEEHKRELLAIVDRVSELEKQRADIERNLHDLTHKAADISHKAELDVFMETDSGGRRQYSNEQLRKAGLSLRLHADNQYQQLGAQIQELRLQDKLMAIECVDLKARYQVLLAFAAPGSERVSFPSLQWEDLDLLAASVGLPTRLTEFLSQIAREASAVSQPPNENASGKLLQDKEQLTRLDQELARIDAEYDAVRHQAQLIRDQVLLEVAAEQDEDGRLVNRSSQLREAALRLRLEQHTDYQRLQAQLQELYSKSRNLLNEKYELRNREHDPS